MKRLLALLFLLSTPVAAQEFRFPVKTADPYTCTGATEGFGYMNRTSHTPYVCNASAWTSLFEVNHNLLSATHSDTLAASVVRGDLIVGNSSPAWSRLAIGAANRFLHSDGNDAAWTQVTLTTDVTGVLPIANGGTNASSFTTSNALVKWDATRLVTSDILDTTSSVTAASFAPTTFTIGAYSNASPSTAFYGGINATGTDIGGGNVTIEAGQSTGTGAAGQVNIQVAPNSTTGSSNNALKTALSLTGQGFTLGNVTMNSGGASVSGSSANVIGYNAAGTDIAGGPLNISAGAGTGTGVPGILTFKVAPPSTTGSTLNTQKTAMQFQGNQFLVGGWAMNSGAAAPNNPSAAFQGISSTGTDQAGTFVDVRQGLGTGAGAGGGVRIQVAPPIASATTQQTATTAASFAGTSYTIGTWDTISGGAVPAGSTIRGVDAAGTDIAGGALTVGTGQSTGTGTAASLTFQVAPNSTTGTTQNTLKTAAVFSGTSFTVGNVTINSGGAATAASTVQGYNGAGTDSAGGALSVNGGQGTGTGAAGSVTIKVAPNAATGSSANALTTAATFSGTAVTVGNYGINSGGSAAAASTYGGVNGGGTDNAGGNVVLVGGRSTGTGTAGTVTIQVAPPATGTGSSVNTAGAIEAWATNSTADPQLRTVTLTGSNGATWVRGSNSELITLSTVGTTTDSTNNLLPANSILQGVVCRVTTTITTATDWAIGDGTTATRFCAANATLTAGTTEVCLNHMKGGVATDAAGPTQAAAAKLRITTTGTPGAGVVRCEVFYNQFTVPTS